MLCSHKLCMQVLPSCTWPCVFPLAWLFPMSQAMVMVTFKQPMRLQTRERLCKPSEKTVCWLVHRNLTLLCRCWLNPYSDFVWTYTVPVLVVILMNSGFFVMALVIMYRHAKRQDHKLKVQKAWQVLPSSIQWVHDVYFS